MAKAKKGHNRKNNTTRVSDVIVDAAAQEDPDRKPRKTYSEDEKQESMDTLNTQGKKGLKAMRINMAFTPELHEYIKIMSDLQGTTITNFVNGILMQHLEQNRESYEEAKDLIKRVRDNLKSL